MYRAISFLGYSRLDITKHRNTYTLSKALAEDVVCSFRKSFPIVIIRPSLVWGAIAEPCPGYIEGMQSTMGLICGAMTGFIRNMYSPKGIRIRCTPVDFVINATIASAWKRSVTTETNDVLFFNCTDVDENPTTWEKSIEMSRKLLLKYAPYKKIIWYPKITCTSSFTWHMISLLLFQLIPAFFLDGIRFLSGKKPMCVVVELNK
jgi:alcohol-forming fatty acyl-CoA reductase